MVIGIIGASGQVGTEVSLFLKTYPDVRPVAIVRHPLSGAILRRLNVEVRISALESEAECRKVFDGCDLIADFSAPAGETLEIERYYEGSIAKALRHCGPKARYVFISTINAFGMSTQFNRAKNYWVPHSVYARTKRYGEKRAKVYGTHFAREIFILRLGHVHGLLQRVSYETRELVKRPYKAFVYPNTPSYTIFCHSIAEAMRNIAAGKEAPGTYTTVSVPPWSWKEVLEHFSDQPESLNVELVPMTHPRLPRKIINDAKRLLMQRAVRYKDTLRANVLPYFPAFEARSKARFYTAAAMAQVAAYQERLIYRPSGIHEGVFPGPRLASLSDSRVTMPGKAAEVAAMLNHKSAGW